ncbi:acyl carrier protein [Streptomyces iconiensis]|uniref:Acyl carrier protein n=1 Tax=Streptomyces iconiensis TaxID=1384038 RepID=A0ABT6ZXX3_9ACTN|nr:acyl carrier protein [Streptomyces iconiensis]MDJ1133659.1 acyl carrier protein [Streptomyces iconiensis]
MTTETTHTGGIHERVTALLEERLGLLPEEVTRDAKFKEDLGLDSLDMVELLTLVETETGQDVDDGTAPSMATVGDVIDYLAAHGGGDAT